MTLILRKGRYGARLVATGADLLRAQRLRHHCFLERGAAQSRADGLDSDRFDQRCQHILIENAAGRAVATFRFMPFASGADTHMSYTAQHYDLEQFSRYDSPMAELGRFCIAPTGTRSGLPYDDGAAGRTAEDGEALRAAWGALTGLVHAHGIATLFGCASFPGADPGRHSAALAHLNSHHLGPCAVRPPARVPGAVPLADQPAGSPRAALRQMPPLLRSYLAMGGWVGGQAVVDPVLDTLHVFTALEIATMPPARVRSLLAWSS